MNPQNPPQPQVPQSQISGQPTNVNSVLSAMGQNISQLQNVPQQVKDIQGQYNVANDPTVLALRSQQADKIKQLFDHDTQLAQTYFQTQQAPGPQPTNPAYTPPQQMVVDPTIGMRAATQQNQATAAEMADIGTQIANRKDILTEGLAKAMQLFQFGLEARKMEQEALNTELQASLSKNRDILDLLTKVGGKVSPDMSSYYGLPEGTDIPGEIQRALAIKKGEYTVNPQYQPVTDSEIDQMFRNDPNSSKYVPQLKALSAVPTLQHALIKSIVESSVTKPVTPEEVSTVTEKPTLGNLWGLLAPPKKTTKQYVYPEQTKPPLSSFNK